MLPFLCAPLCRICHFDYSAVDCPSIAFLYTPFWFWFGRVIETSNAAYPAALRRHLRINHSQRIQQHNNTRTDQPTARQAHVHLRSDNPIWRQLSKEPPTHLSMSKPRVDHYTHTYLFFCDSPDVCKWPKCLPTNTQNRHDHPPALLSSARLTEPNLHYKCALFNFLRPAALERGYCTPPTAFRLLRLTLSLSEAFICARARTVCICICILTSNRRINLRQPHATWR